MAWKRNQESSPSPNGYEGRVLNKNAEMSVSVTSLGPVPGTGLSYEGRALSVSSPSVKKGKWRRQALRLLIRVWYLKTCSRRCCWTDPEGQGPGSQDEGFHGGLVWAELRMEWRWGGLSWETPMLWITGCLHDRRVVGGKVRQGGCVLNNTSFNAH